MLDGVQDPFPWEEIESRHSSSSVKFWLSSATRTVTTGWWVGRHMISKRCESRHRIYQ